ncbi:type 1 fimbrial protein [Salmonella enterica subsp. enterica serovar Adelaide]|nr:type 1 fimbrial protein [Salmonella enterica subsp. enterica serovar Adelaide]
MIRKTLIAAATVAAVMSSASVFAESPPAASSTGKFGGGTITFTGSVTEAPCSIPAGEANQNIDLGVVSNKLLVSSKPGSDPVAVKINLKNCDLGGSPAYTKASLKFLNDGKLDATDLTKGFLQTTGPANVAVQLLDKSGITPIDFTSDAKMQPATDTSLTTGADSTVTFWAHLVGKTGSTSAPSAGSVTAQVSYQLDYH